MDNGQQALWAMGNGLSTKGRWAMTEVGCGTIGRWIRDYGAMEDGRWKMKDGGGSPDAVVLWLWNCWVHMVAKQQGQAT